MGHKVIICIPTQNTVLARMAFSLAFTVGDLERKGIKWDILMRQGCDIVGSRIWLLKKAREMGGTHALFIDDDMFFINSRANPIKQLLEDDKDIVGADYHYRHVPLESISVPLEGIKKKEPYKCKSLGTGFMLIKLSILEKLDEPWFTFGRRPDGELAFGEDTYFCQLAIKAGFEVWCDPRVQVKHIGEYDY